MPHSDTLVFSKYISETFFRFVFYAFPGPVGVVAAACFSRFLSHRPTAYLGLWSVAALVCTMRTRDSCVFKVVASSSRFSCITGCTCAEPLPLKHLTLIYFDVQVHLPLTYMCSGMRNKHVLIHPPIIQTRHAYGLWHRPESAAGQTSFLLWWLLLWRLLLWCRAVGGRGPYRGRAMGPREPREQQQDGPTRQPLREHVSSQPFPLLHRPHPLSSDTDRKAVPDYNRQCGAIDPAISPPQHRLSQASGLNTA